MAKPADFTIEPDLMKGEIDEHVCCVSRSCGYRANPIIGLLSRSRSATVSAAIILGARLGDAGFAQGREAAAKPGGA
jgi:hypothetical protein